MAAAMLLLLTTALLGAIARGQDLDLADAVDDQKKPHPTPKKPSGGIDDLDLSDALGGNGDFSNADLEDVAGGGGRGPGDRGGGSSGPRSDQPDPEASGAAPQGLIPGIVGAVVAALAGAVSSFVAYQKKKLCFREAGPAPV